MQWWICLPLPTFNPHSITCYTCCAQSEIWYNRKYWWEVWPWTLIVFKTWWWRLGSVYQGALPRLSLEVLEQSYEFANLQKIKLAVCQHQVEALGGAMSSIACIMSLHIAYEINGRIWIWRFQPWLPKTAKCNSLSNFCAYGMCCYVMYWTRRIQYWFFLEIGLHYLISRESEEIGFLELLQQEIFCYMV